jgi:hypothetical protein
MGLTARLFVRQKPPWAWLGHLAILLPVSAVASSLASMVNQLVPTYVHDLFRLDLFGWIKAFSNLECYSA